MSNYWINELQMWTNEFDFVIARTEDEARLYAGQLQFGKVSDALERYKQFEKEELDVAEWNKLDLDSNFTFREDDGSNREATVRQFIEENGPCYFACSEY